MFDPEVFVDDNGIEKWIDCSVFIWEYLKEEKNMGAYLRNDGRRYKRELVNNKFEGYGITIF